MSYSNVADNIQEGIYGKLKSFAIKTEYRYKQIQTFNSPRASFDLPIVKRVTNTATGSPK